MVIINPFYFKLSITEKIFLIRNKKKTDEPTHLVAGCSQLPASDVNKPH